MRAGEHLVINQGDDLPTNLVFMHQGEEVGRFEYDRDTRLWSFTGELAPAAKIFARSMFLQFEYMLQDEIDKRASLIAEANVTTEEDPDVKAELNQRRADNAKLYDPEDPPL